MVLSVCLIFFFILLRFNRLSNNYGEAFRDSLVQCLCVCTYLVVSHFGVKLGRFNLAVSQHFADGFKWNPVPERDFGGIGMASGMKDQRTANVTELCDTFQVEIHRAV